MPILLGLTGRKFNPLLHIVSLSLAPGLHNKRTEFHPSGKIVHLLNSRIFNPSLHIISLQPQDYVHNKRTEFHPSRKVVHLLNSRIFNPSLPIVSLSLAPGLHNKRTEFHPPLEKLSICATGGKCNPSLHAYCIGSYFVLETFEC